MMMRQRSKEEEYEEALSGEEDESQRGSLEKSRLAKMLEKADSLLEAQSYMRAIEIYEKCTLFIFQWLLNGLSS